MSRSFTDIARIAILIAFVILQNFCNAHAEQNDTTGMSKVANGKPAVHRPYQIQLLHNRQFICSGSILHQRWILTAAHCLKDANPQVYHIITGSQYESQYYGPDYIYGVIVVYAHQNYGGGHHYNDIGLLMVDRPIKFFGNRVGVIGLSREQVPPETILRIAGWGGTERSRSSQRMMETKVRVVPNAYCDPTIMDSQICGAAVYQGSKACMGDSGGPLTTEDQKIVIGVVSFGFDRQCPSQRPVVYTNVASYVDWIFAVVKYYNSVYN